jgi:hypothetical protein
LRISETTHEWFNIKHYAKYEQMVTNSAIEQWDNLISEIYGLSGR